MEEIKQRMKRKQTKVSQEENIGLIEQERFKIRAQMVEHVAQCQ